MIKWTEICGGHFNITDGQFLGKCFKEVVINIPCYVLLSICCAYYLGRTGPPYNRLSHHLQLIYFRLAIVSFLFIGCIATTLGSHFLNFSDFNGIDYILVICSSFAWLLYAKVTYSLRTAITYTARGPILLVICVILTFSASVVDLCGFVMHPPTEGKFFRFASLVSIVTLQVCLLITLFPKGSASFGYRELRYINEQDSEREPLLQQGGNKTFEENLGNAADTSNAFSKIMFYWVIPLLRKGSQGALKTCRDLYDLPLGLRAETITSKVNGNLRKTKESLRHQRNLQTILQRDVEIRLPKRFMVTLFNACFGFEFYSLGLLKIIVDSLTFSGPVLLNKIISFLEDKKEPVSHGYWYASALFVLSFLAAFLGTHYTYLVSKVGLKVRSAAIGLIYRKTLAISRSSMSGFSTGEIVDFMSTDADRIANFCQSFHQVWSLPFQIGVVLFLLYQQIGLSFLAGFTFAVLLVPLNWKIASKIASLSINWMDRKDKRLKLMSEVITGIRVIKMYAWENIFCQKVKLSRDEEMLYLKKKKYLDSFCVYFWATTPVIISVLTFTMYTLLGNTLTAAKVFTSLALFKMLITPLNAFPWVLNGVIEAWISLVRIEAFLNVEDLDLESYYSQEKDGDDRTILKIRNGQFSWRSNDDSNDPPNTHTFGPINLVVKKGEFVGIVGHVGSGKSSFLSAIVADLKLCSGSISLEPKYLTQGIGYVSQEPWIQHASIQQNILFGKPYNQEQYRNVLEACALIEDLKQFPAGDQTEVGERGITLSGGQKARLGLARAIYQDLDIYLLDDPFSAVDVHVARTIYKRCIRDLLRDKTIILCTHHVKYLVEADHVAVLEDGVIVRHGLPLDVLQMEFNHNHSEEKQQIDTEVLKKADKTTTENALVPEEEREFGSIGLHVYKTYWSAVGTVVGTICLLAFFLMQGSSIVSDWWLAYWSSNNVTVNLSSPFHLPEIHANRSGKKSVTFYLAVYCGIGIANSLFTLVRAFSFQSGGIRSAVTLHTQLLDSILNAPAKFFDTTPMGRILNRFSSDMNMVDDSLPFVLNMFLSHGFGVVGTVGVTIYGIPWMVAFILPLGIVYFYIQRFYRRTSREIKRLQSVTLSPLYAHFSETVTGLTTIRAMAAVRRFCQENDAKLDSNQQAAFASLVAAQWLSLVLQMIGVIVVTAVAFFAVFQHHVATVDPGMMGLTMSYVLSLTLLLSKLIASFTETEKEMVSVERIGQYISSIEGETKDYILEAPAAWPELGAITFREVVLRYNPSHPPALRGVSFSVLPGEKLGIVGRTGSGKSSIFQALFRMVPLEGGEIRIDGINVQHLEISQYRSRLAIIPQDPFLFTGSVRENLDPGDSFSDSELWQALEQCHLSECINRIGGLEGRVDESGQNLSVGQRQLFCLARALLSHAKIICMDEATASVDHETDQAIQETIRNTFLESTVLTVAHRIETITESDQVLVMDGGRVVEIGPTKKVLRRLSHLSSFLMSESPAESN